MIRGAATAMVVLTWERRGVHFELGDFRKLGNRKANRRGEMRNNAQPDNETSNSSPNSN